ncbi:MAG: sugar-binding transcriptional regulator [Candidatus Limnocylindrales bacterium]
MTSSPAATSLASQVARLYFDRGMTKVEIAAHLGISRFRVARLLDGALADGLVRIEYRDVPAEDRELANAMEERFGLDLCAVAAGAPGAATRLGGTVLDGLIGPGEVVGIAWGSTLAAVVPEIPPRQDPTIEVVQLAGSSARLGRGRDAGELARTLADRLGASHRAIYAPAFVGSPAVRRGLMAQPEVAEAAARFKHVTLAIVGIGAMVADERGPASSLVRSGVLGAAEIGRLVGLGAIGDLVVHPFDRDGRFVAPDLAARAISIGVEDLRAVRRVVAIAVGSGKAGAIRGALASGIVRILVTDAPTARAVLAAR